MLKMWPSHDSLRGERTGTPVGNPDVAAGPSFIGQTLSCIKIQNSSTSSVESLATAQFAVQGPGAWTSVRSCNFSILYARPTVNTLIGEYMAATITASSSSSLLQIRELTPNRLLELGIASYVNLFHTGPPSVDGAEPVTDGFIWVSWLSASGVSYIPAAAYAANSPFNYRNPFDVLYNSDSSSDDGQISYYTPADIGQNYNISDFDETVLLKPLAFILRQPAFFSNGTTAGVAFKTEIDMVHGKVPPALALVMLMLPIAWTLALSVLANTQKKWTASLDSFAIFKLGETGKNVSRICALRVWNLRTKSWLLYLVW